MERAKTTSEPRTKSQINRRSMSFTLNRGPLLELDAGNRQEDPKKRSFLCPHTSNASSPEESEAQCIHNSNNGCKRMKTKPEKGYISHDVQLDTVAIDVTLSSTPKLKNIDRSSYPLLKKSHGSSFLPQEGVMDLKTELSIAKSESVLSPLGNPTAITFGSFCPVKSPTHYGQVRSIECSSKMEKSRKACDSPEDRQGEDEDVKIWKYYPYNELYKGRSKLESPSESSFTLSNFDEGNPEDYYTYLYGCSPEPNFSPNMKSPHEAPYEPGVPARNQIRDEVVLNHNNLLFPNADRFVNLIEERLVHWRPTDSQQNAEQLLDGQHPYQVHQSRNSKGVIDVIKDWFSRPKVISQPSEPIAARSSVGDYRTPTTADILRVFKNIQLKANTEESIVDFSSRARTGSTNPVTLLTTGSTYARTPQALTFPEFEINYMKQTPGVAQLEQEPALLDTLDRFFVGIVDAVSLCFMSCWN